MTDRRKVDINLTSDLNAMADKMGQAFAETVEPLLSDLKDEVKKSNDNAKAFQDELVNAIQNISIESPEINIPEMKMPEIRVPEPRVTVNTPAMRFPEFPKFPEQRPIFGDVNLKSPLPVILTDFNGKPYSAEQIVSGGSGFRVVTIGNIMGSAYGAFSNPDNRLRVSLETGGSGLTDSELRATAVPVSQVSGAMDSVNVVDAFGSTAVSGVWNADNRLRVSLETGGSGLTDSELRASRIYVEQVSGANWSTSITDIFGSAAANVVNPDGRLKVELPTGASGLTDTELRASRVYVEQVSGASWSTSTSIDAQTVTLQTQQVSGAIDSVNVIGTVPVSVAATLGVDQVSGAIWSTSISGAIASAVVTGPSPVGTVDDGTAPVQGAGIARTANPTAITNGGVVKSTHDDLGRQVFRVHQVRDLISTARATISNGTETTLLAAVAGSYLDLVSVMCANNSDAATSVDLRAVTAGNIVQTIQVPANGTAGWAPQTPWPQDETGNNWTADLPDITGTTISISALFSREV